MLNVNAFVLLCLELNSRRVDSAETNNFIVWPNDESYLPVCRDSSASIELTRHLGYQADTESTASAFSSVGKHADNRRHTDIANFAFAESRNVVILACDN